jgi:hypothetical protein
MASCIRSITGPELFVAEGVEAEDSLLGEVAPGARGRGES